MPLWFPVMKDHRSGAIALLTDFGTRDWYVGALKGVIASRAPGVPLIDITHEVPPHDVMAGAFTLAAVVPWFPIGTVFLAVVDPEVGSRRSLVAARVDGRYLVGPDNGLLALCIAGGRHVRIIRLTNSRYWLTPLSRTFHGRDIMAPVAAHLATGGTLASLGVPMRRIIPLALPSVERRGRTMRGRIVHIDAFGNLVTNLRPLDFGYGLDRETFARSRPERAKRVEGRLPAHAGRGRAPRCRYKRRDIRVVSSYAEGSAGELIAITGSLGMVELAVRARSAQRLVHAKRGDPVELIG